MRYLTIIFFSTLLLTSCIDRTAEKEIVTDNLPTGRIDSLTNDAILNIELPKKS